MRNNSLNVVQFTPKLKEVLLTHFNGQCVIQPQVRDGEKGRKDKAACPRNEKKYWCKISRHHTFHKSFNTYYCKSHLLKCTPSPISSSLSFKDPCSYPHFLCNIT